MEVIAWVKVKHPKKGFQTWYIAGDSGDAVSWVENSREHAHVYENPKKALAALEASTEWAREFPYDLGVSPA